MDIWRNKRLLATVVGVIALAIAISPPFSLGQTQTKNSCLDCHSALPDPYGVTPETFAQDIHAQKGLTCASCHGGDPNSDDPSIAMNKRAGWKGHIDRKQIPQLCGSCHSDAAYMKQFDPSLRTDQLSEYKTSVHGKRLASGDTKVAVCVDCHSVHDLKPPADPRSKVNPTNVASTCSHCHADPEYMKGYGLPTDQFANYSKSVHHDALALRGDLSAPTCSTCHGNHGAAPPGVDRVANVCSTCHVFQAQMYEKSTHKEAFQKASLPGCVVCHSNHGITHPTDAKLGTGPEAVCMRCHTPGDVCDQARAGFLSGLKQLDADIRNADHALAVAESSGMEVSEAQLAQSQARDSLTKARVTIHSFRKDLINQDVQSGLAIADKNLRAGQNAMIERNRRRVGLAFSLIAIGLMIAGLTLYIRQIEGRTG